MRSTHRPYSFLNFRHYRKQFQLVFCKIWPKKQRAIIFQERVIKIQENLGQSLYIVSMSQEKPVLLLVENDPLSLSLYDRELNPYYSILNCKNEADAMFALKSEKVSLIILEPASGNDWVWDLLKQIKMKEETAKIPVIFCSVLDEKKKGLEQGASAYLIKPVYANVLRQYVQEFLKTQ